jgi:biopolymer transport protein ExbD
MFGKKNRKGAKPDEVALGRVVTPMLDMTFQLLFFFVMQFKPPIAEGQIDFNLPSDTIGPSSNAEPKLEEKPDEYKLSIVSRSGIPEVMTWKRENAEPESIPLDETGNISAMVKAFEEKLKTITKPKPGQPSPVIKIESGKKLKYSILIQFMDTCKKNGFNDVGVMPLGKDKD